MPAGAQHGEQLPTRGNVEPLRLATGVQEAQELFCQRLAQILGGVSLLLEPAAEIGHHCQLVSDGVLCVPVAGKLLREVVDSESQRSGARAESVRLKG